MKNISQVQVGHLPRQLVAKLAPLLDSHLVTVEGVINDGNRMCLPCLSLYFLGFAKPVHQSLVASVIPFQCGSIRYRLHCYSLIYHIQNSSHLRRLERKK